MSRAQRLLSSTTSELGDVMRKPYESPNLIVYGRIADSTFTTPNGQVKGCKVDCHLDNFGEQSALTVTGS